MILGLAANRVHHQTEDAALFGLLRACEAGIRELHLGLHAVVDKPFALDFRSAAELVTHAERAGRLFWLNPEPKLYWNYGDSVMAAYERYCDGAFECWTTRHLENFVNVVAGGVPAAE